MDNYGNQPTNVRPQQPISQPGVPYQAPYPQGGVQTQANTFAGQTGANAGVASGSAGMGGRVVPTTGEKIEGTIRKVVGEIQGNPRKIAEGAALKEGTHPVQSGPYAQQGRQNF